MLILINFTVFNYYYLPSFKSSSNIYVVFFGAIIGKEIVFEFLTNLNWRHTKVEIKFLKFTCWGWSLFWMSTVDVWTNFRTIRTEILSVWHKDLFFRGQYGHRLERWYRLQHTCFHISSISYVLFLLRASWNKCLAVL